MRNLTFVFFFSAAVAFSQAPDHEKLDPLATEIWEPKPAKVEPGVNPYTAPSDAIVLFNGKDLSEWTSQDGGEAKWIVKDGSVTVVKGAKDIKTKKTFGDVQLHIEWRVPAEIVSEGQGRGNSGIFLQERYEVQVLDSYESRTYSNGQAGSIYKQAIPLVNPTRKAGEWQTYDIIYTAPRFSENGRVIIPAYITVLMNGVLVQNHTQIRGGTDYRGAPIYLSHGKASLKLQDHGNPVSYRNIWVREL